jgi:hypothetical protein
MNVLLTGKATKEEIQEAVDHYELDFKKILAPDERDFGDVFANWAQENEVDYEVRKPEWSNVDPESTNGRVSVGQNKFGPYNKRAAFNRNEDLVTESDVVVLFGNDRTSSHIEECAEKQEKKILEWPELDEHVPF